MAGAANSRRRDDDASGIFVVGVLIGIVVGAMVGFVVGIMWIHRGFG